MDEEEKDDDKQMGQDQLKHQIGDDEKSPLGSAPEDVVEDLDEQARKMGIRTDTQGPRELDLEQDMRNDRLDEWEK